MIHNTPLPSEFSPSIKDRSKDDKAAKILEQKYIIMHPALDL
jgi:hypothetical protein